MPLKLYLRDGVFHYRGTIGPRGRRKRFRGSCFTADKDIAARQVSEIEAGYWRGHFDGPGAVLTFAHACVLYRAAGKNDPFLTKVEARLGHTLIKDITESTIQMMAKELYPRATGASLNRLVIVPALSVINHSARSGFCSRLMVERYTVDSKVKEPATLEWVNRFVAEAHPHLGAMVLFMYVTGARPGEAIGLQWDDLDLQAATALIRESKVSKERKAHLPARLVAMLANLKRIKDRGVFVYTAPNATRKAWEASCKRAGIKDLSPHSCRHGFATGLLRRGVDVVTVAWLGGWASPQQVLKTYGHANKNPMLTDLLLGPELTRNEQGEAERPAKILINDRNSA